MVKIKVSEAQGAALDYLVAEFKQTMLDVGFIYPHAKFFR